MAKGTANQLELITAVHVDDDLLAGTKEKTDEFLDEFERHLNVVHTGIVDKHLGVTHKCGQDKCRKCLKGSMQDHVEDLIKECKELVGNKAPLSDHPGHAGECLTKKNTEEAIDINDCQSLTRKSVCLVCKVSLVCANAA